MKNKLSTGTDLHPFYTAHKHELSPQKFDRLVNALMSHAGNRAVLYESGDYIAASDNHTAAFHDEPHGHIRSAALRRSTATGYEKQLSSPGLVFRNGSSPVAVRKMEVARLCRLESSRKGSAWLLERPFGLDGLWSLTLENYEC